MPSIKPKIQGYVEPELFSAFEQWRIDQNKGISEALNDLLKEFFEFEKPAPGLSREQIEELNAFRVEFKNEVWLQLKREFAIWNQFLQEGLSSLDSRLQAAEEMLNVKGGVPTLLQEALETVQMQKYVIKEMLIAQELEEESKLSSLEQEDAEANPLEIPPQSPAPLEGLKQSELERRLKIAKGTLTKRRNRDDFKDWSREHDPDKVAWMWDAIARKYLAIE